MAKSEQDPGSHHNPDTSRKWDRVASWAGAVTAAIGVFLQNNPAIAGGVLLWGAGIAHLFSRDRRSSK